MPVSGRKETLEGMVGESESESDTDKGMKNLKIMIVMIKGFEI